MDQINLVQLDNDALEHVVQYLFGEEFSFLRIANDRFYSVRHPHLDWINPFVKKFALILLSDFDTVVLANSYMSWYYGFVNDYNNINIYVTDNNQDIFNLLLKWKKFVHAVKFFDNNASSLLSDPQIHYLGKLDRSFGIALKEEKVFVDKLFQQEHKVKITKDIAKVLKNIKLSFCQKTFIISLVQVDVYEKVYNYVNENIYFTELDENVLKIVTRAQLILEMFFCVADRFGAVVLKNHVDAWLHPLGKQKRGEAECCEARRGGEDLWQWSSYIEKMTEAQLRTFWINVPFNEPCMSEDPVIKFAFYVNEAFYDLYLSEPKKFKQVFYNNFNVNKYV